MHSRVTYRRSIIVILCLLLLISVIFPHIDSTPKTYSDDGIWEDTFDKDNDTENYVFTNTKMINGVIELEKGGDESRSYNFTDNFKHYAYAYRTVFFFQWGRIFSPATHIARENMFDEKMYDSIKKIDDIYANWSSTWFQNFVVHHFRFQLGSSADVIKEIKFSWYGKNTSIPSIYIWNSSKCIIGVWQKFKTDVSGYVNGAKRTITVTKGDIKYALNDNNYIDICVVAGLFFKRDTLSTDYVELNTTGESIFSIQGSAETSNPISPTDISNFKDFYWETLTWEDDQGDGTMIRYQLLNENSTLIPNEYFLNNPEGNNSYGFTQSPVYLNAIPYEKLKIRAKLNTSSSSRTPRLFSWALTWQNSSQWQDSFDSSYRVAVKNKMVIQNSSVDISEIQGEWPMFGFNPENNRATPGPGPSTGNLYWYSENVGGGFRNPIIGYGKVYIASSRVIYQFNMKFSSGGSSKLQRNTSNHAFNSDIVNSPVITEDYVIVATGQTSDGGYKNNISFLPRENIAENPDWVFTTESNICYFSSPVVAGNTIFITSWGGDIGTYIDENKRHTNNKLLAVDFKNKNEAWNVTLSAPSFSTPAVSLSSEIVVAGCSSSKNDSLFAFTLDGKARWTKKIGSIGYAAPVIYKDMVFATATSKTGLSFNTNIYALNLTSGEMLWNKTICSSIYQYDNEGDSTPAIFNDILYIASPDGKLFALNASSGKQLWDISIYSRSLFSPQSLISSPVYADGNIYIGLPTTKDTDMQIVAISTTTHNITWSVRTFWQQEGEKRSPILGSPIVSNGLMFIADEDGNLYSIGTYKIPTQEVNGFIISFPIQIPTSYWWNQFFTYSSYNKTISTITFSLLDENNNVLKDLLNKSSLLMDTLTLPRTIRLRADFTTKNISADNPTLLRWVVTFKKDTIPPFLNNKTITPPFSGWLNFVVPRISIKVNDSITGLLVNSGRYTLQYVLDNKTYTNTYSAHCTGTNGTTGIETLTANLTEIPDYPNITALKSIKFSIKDLAGNTGTIFIQIHQDITAPTSFVLTQLLKPRYNETAKFIWINATTYDNGTNASGIKFVQLFYRYSSFGNFSGVDWVYFDNSTPKSSSWKFNSNWKFNFTSDPNQPGGYFEVCTIATDIADNTEEFPAQGDASFIYDWKKPDLPSFSGETLWFNTLPSFSVTFSDDFRLNTIQYSLNFESVWTTIASHVNSSTYNTDAIGHSWSLAENFWDKMEEDEIYYLYFKINDTVGNTLLVTSNSDALTIRKDTSPPTVGIDIPEIETEWTWLDTFQVSGSGNDQDGSGIKEAILYYRFSEDKKTWTSWTTYGNPIDSSPFEWEFKAKEGDGYYQVKINITDYAGNVGDSKVISFDVASFPTTLALILIGLILVLLSISTIIFFKWRKK